PAASRSQPNRLFRPAARERPWAANSSAFGLLLPGYSSDQPLVTSANLKLKYASAAFASVLLATAAVIGFFVWRRPPDMLTVQGVSGLAVLGSIAAAVIAWRAARGIQFSTAALIRSADRVGQGDYTRQIEVRRSDIIG